MNSKTHDRWFSFVRVKPREETVQGFLRGLSPAREEEMLVVSSIQVGGIGYSIHHIFRRGSEPDSFAGAFLISKREGEPWGIYLDLSGAFPRRYPTGALGAFGLDHASHEGRVSVTNSLGIDLEAGSPLLGGIADSVQGWAHAGAGLLVVSTATSRSGALDAKRLVPDFYSSLIPVVHAEPGVRQSISEIVGHGMPADHIILLGRKPFSDEVELLFSGKLRDKTTGRRLRRSISKASGEYSDLVSEFLPSPSAVAKPDGTRGEVSPAADTAPEMNEALLERIAELESELLAEQVKTRRLSRAYDYAMRSEEEPKKTSPVAQSPEVTEQTPESVEITPAQKASLDRQAETFSSFAALVAAARVDLPHVLIRDEIEESATPLDTLPPANNWRNQTWRCLLAMNEYAEARSEGRFSGNFHEFILRHPHPLVSVRRVAMRESDTVRDSTLYMKDRFFDFDGVPVPMEAHFKIDVSGRHPAPRMHFDEFGGIIRVGYIGAHLRTKRTN